MAPAAAPTPPPAASPAAAPGAAPDAPPGAAPAPPPAATAPPAAVPGTPPPIVNAPPPAVPYDGPPLLFASKGKTKLGAYGGLGVAYTHMLHRDGAVIDLSAAMLVDHRLSLGLAGYGFTRSPNGPNLGFTPREYQTFYGGFLLRYAFYTDIPLYVSVGALVGGGTLALVEDYDRSYNDYDNYDDHHHADFRGFFVFQPDLSLHVNATRWLRLTATGGYRVATGVHDFGYDSTAMSGVVVGGKVEIGWF
ncbi:MAG TPA: hypothetical protein VGQ57_03890 [Polyangiaceae bacterium]|nr:hypothetical protein [Polyangiaceae bacterium]